MRGPQRYSTTLWIASLACLLFGFVPLLVVGVTAAMEFAWLFATDASALGWPAAGFATLGANTFDRVLHDWAGLYRLDASYDWPLFATQVACAIFWCAYMSRMCRRLGRR
jgi:hypothetical protein